MQRSSCKRKKKAHVLSRIFAHYPHIHTHKQIIPPFCRTFAQRWWRAERMGVSLSLHLGLSVCVCVCEHRCVSARACVCIYVGGGGYLFWLFSMRVRCVESITIPSIHSSGSNMDVIYMVMQAPWLPQVTQWTSLTMDSVGLLRHPNAMYSHGHTHTQTHTHTHTHTCTSQLQGGMFQLADADRCCAVFVRLGQKVECIAPCQRASVLFSQ